MIAVGMSIDTGRVREVREGRGGRVREVREGRGGRVREVREGRGGRDLQEEIDHDDIDPDLVLEVVVDINYLSFIFYFFIYYFYYILFC
jgi:Uma2 family endonuclease